MPRALAGEKQAWKSDWSFFTSRDTALGDIPELTCRNGSYF